MTLKKQFQVLFNNVTVNENRVDKSVEIADEFALGFGKYLLKNYDGVKSVKELLERYKKEKGL
jgi:hypothetical protein